MKRNIAICVLMLAGLACLPVAAADDDSKKDPPSFMSGATVDLQVTIKAPRQWMINYRMPLSFAFDAEYLKDAPFSVEEQSLTINMEHYAPDLTVVIPVTLNKNLNDGLLKIPMAVTFSICNEVTEFCAFAQETITIPVEVQGVPEPDTKNQALASGTVEHGHLLSIP